MDNRVTEINKKVNIISDGILYEDAQKFAKEWMEEPKYLSSRFFEQQLDGFLIAAKQSSQSGKDMVTTFIKNRIAYELQSKSDAAKPHKHIIWTAKGERLLSYLNEKLKKIAKELQESISEGATTNTKEELREIKLKLFHEFSQHFVAELKLIYIKHKQVVRKGQR